MKVWGRFNWNSEGTTPRGVVSTLWLGCRISDSGDSLDDDARCIWLVGVCPHTMHVKVLRLFPVRTNVGNGCGTWLRLLSNNFTSTEWNNTITRPSVICVHHVQSCRWPGSIPAQIGQETGGTPSGCQSTTQPTHTQSHTFIKYGVHST